MPEPRATDLTYFNKGGTAMTMKIAKLPLGIAYVHKDDVTVGYIDFSGFHLYKKQPPFIIFSLDEFEEICEVHRTIQRELYPF